MAIEPTYRADEDEMSVKDLIVSLQGWVRYLWSKWLILLLAGLIGGALGLWYAFSKAPIYTATTTFVLESGSDSRGSLGRLAGVAAMAGLNLGGDAGGIFQGDNLNELYKSRSMLARTLLTEVHPDSNELLIERYIKYNEIRKEWEKDDRPELLALDFRVDPAVLDPETRRLYEGVITSFTNKIRKEILTVDKPEKNLSITQVNVTTPDEVFSKAFNDNLVKEVNDFYIQTKTKKSTDNIAILEAKVDSVRGVMTGAIYSAARVSDATPHLNPTRQTQRIVPSQEAQFSAETNKAILSQLVQNLEMARMAQMQEQPLIQLVDQPVYPLPVDQLGKAKGIVIGGFLLGFLTLLALIGLKWYRDVMAEEEETPQATD